MANDKLNVKQEKFAQLVVQLGNQSDAYRKAYGSKAKPASVNVNASKLMATAKISLRVQEIRNELRIRNRATLDDILDELEEARKLAMGTAQPAAMNQSSIAKAKLLGLERDIIEQTTTIKLDKPLAERLTGGSKR